MTFWKLPEKKLGVGKDSRLTLRREGGQSHKNFDSKRNRIYNGLLKDLGWVAE
jgi:hypothetical protein